MTQGGKYTHPVFVEIGTDKPLFVHRKGSNIKYGFYYVNSSDSLPNVHYGMKENINVAQLRKEFEALKAMSVEEATKDSPFLHGRFNGKVLPQHYYDVKSQSFTASAMNYSKRPAPSEDQVRKILAALDSQNRWLVKHEETSHPYIGDGVKSESNDDYASTNMGDETDTSPYRDPSDQDYISTNAYIRNMTVLINYINAMKVQKK